MMGLLALLWLAPSLALAPPAASRIRRRRVARGAGAFPEVEFASSPRQSLRGVWRLRRDCEEDATAIDDIIVTLKASGTFSSAYFPLVEPADEAVAATMRTFAAALKGRWYSDSDDGEVRLARFERQSPVEWYTGMPANKTAPLSAIRGHVTFGASEPEWIGRFAMEPLWPETHAALPRLPAARATTPFAAPAAAAGAWFLVCTGGVAADDDERVAFEVALHKNRTWETIDGFDGSASRREGGISVSAAGAASLRDLVSLERAAAEEARADRAFLRRALGEGRETEARSRLAGTWDIFDEDDEDGINFFAGAPGAGSNIFLWCRRTGGDAARVSSGVSIDSDLLFVGVLDGDGAVARAAEGVISVGWNTEPCFVGAFTLARQKP